MESSVFILYSLGTAAENMEFGTQTLEVTPLEALSGIDGNVTSNLENITTEGENAAGQKYTQNINAGNSIEAIWLSRNANRPFPPLIRLGEKVLIWRNADTDQFYWEEMGVDIRYRRGDILCWACPSTIINEDDPISHMNSYWFEIDSLNGVVRQSTTKLNGEATAYVWELMCREGVFNFKDDIGNYMKLESVDQRWTIANAADTILVMDGPDTTLSMQGTYKVKAQDVEYDIGNSITFKSGQSFNVQTTTIDMKASAEFSLNAVAATMTASANINLAAPSIGLAGALTSTGAGGGPGSASFSGTSKFDGNTEVNGTLMNNGMNVSSHNHKDPHGGETGPMQ